MKLSNRRLLFCAVLLILLCAGAGFCIGSAGGAGWEARATVAVYSPDALTALPGVIASDPLTARSIPGTHLMTLSVSGTVPAEVSHILQAALDRIPTGLSWLGITANTELLCSSTRQLQSPDPLRSCLNGGLLGLAAAVILFSSPAFPREPLSLWAILVRSLKLTRRLWLPVLAVIFLCAGGNFMRTLDDPPVYRSEALIRAGTFRPETTAAVSTAFQGLISSDLVDEAVEAEPLGSSNLFRLSCSAATPEEAHGKLLVFLERWPGLTGYSPMDLAMTVLQSPSLPAREADTSPVPALVGGVWGTGVCFAFLLLLSFHQEAARTGKYANN